MADNLEGSDRFLVGAIDFGTTYSGWAFQLQFDYQQDPLKISARNWNNGSHMSQKAPTTVLLRPDGVTFDAFGYEAEDKYADLVRIGEHRNWYYFSQFKMMLYENMRLKRGMLLEASNGKHLPALDVFASAIRYLKDDVMAVCNERIAGTVYDHEVLWVLTVPAIWTDAAKQFMREAGRKAGIQDENIILALEPEAASVYCKYTSLQNVSHSAPFIAGSRYIVVDAGGGTVDITAHEVLADGNIRELHRPVGGYWGGTTVDQKFHSFLCNIFGPVVMETFHEEAPDDYIGLFRVFEVKKRETAFDRNRPSFMDIPHCLAECYKTQTGRSISQALTHTCYSNDPSVGIVRGNKLKIGAGKMRTFFKDSVTKIVRQVGELLNDEFIKPCPTIHLVGGFSESSLMKNALKGIFKDVTILNPDDAGLIVVKGAVLFGRKPSVISQRVCRFTYGHQIRKDFEEGDPEECLVFENGVRKCRHRFQAIVHRGSVVDVNKTVFSEVRFRPVDGEDSMTIDIHKSTRARPRYVMENSCAKIGELTLDLHGVTERECVVGGRFGGTEVQIYVRNISTGKSVYSALNNLD